MNACTYICHSFDIEWLLTASAKFPRVQKFRNEPNTYYIVPKAQPHVRLYLIKEICAFKWRPSAVVRHFTAHVKYV